MKRREAMAGLLYAALPLTGFMFFYIAPFVISVYLTFRSGMGGVYFVGLQNYVDIFQSAAFVLAIGNTFRFMAVGVPLSMSLALATAFLLNGKLRGVTVFRSAYMLPMVIPVSSVILVFQILFEQGGIINAALTSIGFGQVNFLRSQNAFYVLLILYIWKNCGYNIVLFLAGLSLIPKEYYEAAEVDGASGVRQLFSITLPLLVPTGLFVFVMSVVQSFRAFREAFALAGSYPDDSIYMLQHFMNNNFNNLNYARLSTAAFLTFIFIFALVGILFYFRGKTGDYEL